MKIFELFDDRSNVTSGSVYIDKLKSTTIDYLVSLLANGPKEVMTKQVLVFLSNLGHDVSDDTLPELLDGSDFEIVNNKIKKIETDNEFGMSPEVGMPGMPDEDQPSFADQKVSNMARNEINRGMND